MQVRAITVNHGKKIADYQALDRDSQIKVYFCLFTMRTQFQFTQVTTDENLAVLVIVNYKISKKLSSTDY